MNGAFAELVGCDKDRIPGAPADLVKDGDTVETANASLETNVSRAVAAYQARLKQRLENPIRNAVEHGGADVTVTIGELPDGFYVEDDGQGIPEAERESIFGAGHSTNGSDGIRARNRRAGGGRPRVGAPGYRGRRRRGPVRDYGRHVRCRAVQFSVTSRCGEPRGARGAADPCWPLAGSDTGVARVFESA